MSKVNQKTAIVTGASRGLGQATAMRLAIDDFAVIVNYPTASKNANETVAAIEKAGGEVAAVEGDTVNQMTLTGSSMTLRRFSVGQMLS